MSSECAGRGGGRTLCPLPPRPSSHGRSRHKGIRLRHVFQPIVDLRSGGVVAYEALARFPDRGPEAVLREVASLGDAALRTFDAASAASAVCAARAWLPPGARLCLNLTHASVAAAAAGSPLPDAGGFPVTWELSEDAATQAALSSPGAWEALRPLRARLALDDVGGGWADLDRLAAALRNGVRWVKVDRRVVHGAARDPAKRAVLRAVSGLGVLGFEVVAEGVEDLADLAVLAACGVRYAQGLAVGRPVSGPALGREPLRVYLAGPAGSGKSTVAALLAERHGFARAALGDFPRAVAEARGLRPARAVLQALGDEIRGPDPARLARLAMAHVAGAGRAVVDGVRLPEEAEALRAAGFIGIRVEAPDEERRRRLRERGESWRRGERAHPTEAQAAAVPADLRLNASGDRQALAAAVARLVTTLDAGGGHARTWCAADPPPSSAS